MNVTVFWLICYNTTKIPGLYTYLLHINVPNKMHGKILNSDWLILFQNHPQGIMISITSQLAYTAEVN